MHIQVECKMDLRRFHRIQLKHNVSFVRQSREPNRTYKLDGNSKDGSHFLEVWFYTFLKIQKGPPKIIKIHTDSNAVTFWNFFCGGNSL